MKRFLTLSLLVIVVGVWLYSICRFSFQWWRERAYKEPSIQFAFLDIGQGDATFIQFSDKTQMLVDCGKDASILEALGRVMPFYDRTIDYLVVTHPDKDHYAGCIDVMRRFTIRKIVYNGQSKDSDQMWRSFNDALQNELAAGADYMEVNSEKIEDIAGAKLIWLYPDKSLTARASLESRISNNIAIDNPASGQPKAGKVQKVNSNDSSIVFKLSFGDSDALFMADADSGLETYLSDKYKERLDVDVLKVGHHGSDSSSNEAFVNVVSPSIAAISVGRENKYGHPSARVLKRFQRAGARILRTDRDGDIILTFTKKIFFVNSE